MAQAARAMHASQGVGSRPLAARPACLAVSTARPRRSVAVRSIDIDFSNAETQVSAAGVVGHHGQGNRQRLICAMHATACWLDSVDGQARGFSATNVDLLALSVLCTLTVLHLVQCTRMPYAAGSWLVTGDWGACVLHQQDGEGRGTAGGSEVGVPT